MQVYLTPLEHSCCGEKMYEVDKLQEQEKWQSKIQF